MSSRTCRRCRNRFGLTFVLALFGTLVGCSESGSPGAASDEPWFEEIAAETGIDFVHRSGVPVQFWFPEIATGGVGLLDYDGDGLLDVYFVQGGALEATAQEKPANRLFRNDTGMRFEDVTTEAGTGDRGYGMGCAAADYDGDGHVDLYVTNVGANVLYRNRGSRFADVTTAAGVGDPAFGTSSAFLDYDRDGDLDLYVVNYVRWSPETDLICYSGSGEREYCGPNSYQAPAPDTLFRNEGSGVFADVSRASGVRAAFGNGLGVACADYNGDGWIDVYVANDGMPNQMWVNGGDGNFADKALTMGCAVNAASLSEAGMGVISIDVEHDGDVDLYLSHLREETNTMYLNNGRWFDDATARMGLGQPSFEFTGFGLGFLDFDHDRRLDIYVANGRVKRASPSFSDDVHAEPNLVYVAADDGIGFRELAPRGGTSQPLFHTSRAAAFGDLDNDGDPDVVVTNKDAGPYVLRNVAGDGGNWIVFRVLRKSGVHALNASLKLEAGGDTQWRRVQRAYSYCASNDPRVHYGLGNATGVDRITVHWPQGGSEEFGPFEANTIHEVRQGTGR
ncbi:MAG: hypothetical protein CMJ89_06855 [Planctomycetes bacterium]|jgi:hypothetical protein|nr:hypothetical protein [Planctomycetota bacterium]